METKNREIIYEIDDIDDINKEIADLKYRLSQHKKIDINSFRSDIGNIKKIDDEIKDSIPINLEDISSEFAEIKRDLENNDIKLQSIDNTQNIKSDLIFLKQLISNVQPINSSGQQDAERLIQEELEISRLETERLRQEAITKEVEILRKEADGKQAKILRKKELEILRQQTERLRQEAAAKEDEKLKQEADRLKLEADAKEAAAKEAIRLRQEEQVRLEKERLEKERLRQEAVIKETDRLRLEAVAKEAERLKLEELERLNLEADRLRQEATAKEAERLRQEDERLKKEIADKEAEDKEADRLRQEAAAIKAAVEQAERLEQERLEEEILEKKRVNTGLKPFITQNLNINKIRTIEYILSLLNNFNNKSKKILDYLNKKIDPEKADRKLIRLLFYLNTENNIGNQKDLLINTFFYIYNYINLNINNNIIKLYDAVNSIIDSTGPINRRISSFISDKLIKEINTYIWKLIDKIATSKSSIKYISLKEIWQYIDDPDYIGDKIKAGLIIYNNNVHKDFIFDKVKKYNSIRTTSYEHDKFNVINNNIFPKGAIGRADVNEENFNFFNTIKSGSIREFCEETFITQEFLQGILDNENINFETIDMKLIIMSQDYNTNYNSIINMLDINLSYRQSYKNFKIFMNKSDVYTHIYYFIIGINNDNYNKLTSEIRKNVDIESIKINDAINTYKINNPGSDDIRAIRNISNGDNPLSTKSYESNSIYIQKYLKYKAKYLALKKSK